MLCMLSGLNRCHPVCPSIYVSDMLGISLCCTGVFMFLYTYDWIILVDVCHTGWNWQSQSLQYRYVFMCSILFDHSGYVVALVLIYVHVYYHVRCLSHEMELVICYPISPALIGSACLSSCYISILLVILAYAVTAVVMCLMMYYSLLVLYDMSVYCITGWL